MSCCALMRLGLQIFGGGSTEDEIAAAGEFVRLVCLNDLEPCLPLISFRAEEVRVQRLLSQIL